VWAFLNGAKILGLFKEGEKNSKAFPKKFNRGLKNPLVTPEKFQKIS